MTKPFTQDTLRILMKEQGFTKQETVPDTRKCTSPRKSRTLKSWILGRKLWSVKKR